MRQFRLLTADEIECRVNQLTKKGVGLLLYKTARTDYALLDETIGMMYWQNKYEVIDGKMYCCISIRNPETGEWVSKWNCGTESNTEAEKGQASDAMKRAGFAWGIGTELYSAPFIWIPAELCNIEEVNGKLYCRDKFYVKSIGYDDAQDISSLQIVNVSTKAVVFTHPRTKQETASKPPVSAPAARQANTQPTQSNTQDTAKCSECGADVSRKIREYSINRYGYCLCFDCQKKYGSR